MLLTPARRYAGCLIAALRLTTNRVTLDRRIARTDQRVLRASFFTYGRSSAVDPFLSRCATRRETRAEGVRDCSASEPRPEHAQSIWMTAQVLDPARGRQALGTIRLCAPHHAAVAGAVLTRQAAYPPPGSRRRRTREPVPGGQWLSRLPPTAWRPAKGPMDPPHHALRTLTEAPPFDRPAGASLTRVARAPRPWSALRGPSPRAGEVYALF